MNVKPLFLADSWGLWNKLVLVLAVQLTLLCCVRKIRFRAPWDNAICSVHVPKNVWSWAFKVILTKENGKHG